ncbi:sigma-54-dependent Fis family transcriptional regulator [Zhongshania marina]|uniref:Sigma-54-dependent Fis family transcriptional regulator n=2 Tax=Zhongshania marina TaxID=2304603 RepID=A0A2S4HKF6_9GAMM|nr:sigma-54-dependent Fis family transcriptional regulator [Marortus luteolus]
MLGDDNRQGLFTNSENLLSNVRFSPKDGRILLAENRMLLVHASGFGVLRRELIETIGNSEARGLLTRMGYHNGAHDAQLVHNLHKSRSSTIEEFILLGPQLHMLEGTGLVIEVFTNIDVELGLFHGEYLWEGSSEAEIHVQEYGIGNQPVCWMQIGYASGFVSSYMGRPVLFKEVQCVGQGAPCCRIIGKPVEEWGDEQDLEYLKADKLTNGLAISNSDPGSSLGLDGVVGASAGFNAACHKLRQVSETDATVLFLGESGVGKEVFARSLHNISERSSMPFIAVNCAAIPENLVEAELFGVEKGAFTGANKTREGRFERANKGTLFLDEIGILNLSAQGKLLRVLQEREIERIGGDRLIKTDVRVVAATNLDLKEEIRLGRFREDLYYRLNVFPILLPPLRKRLEDIPIFMNYFMKKYCRRHNKDIKGYTNRLITAMLSYDWPGNIRELENLIERGVILAAKDRVIDVHHIFTEDELKNMEYLTVSSEGLITSDAYLKNNNDIKDEISNTSQIINMIKNGNNVIDQNFSIEELEKTLIDKAIEQTNGNKSLAAKLLGITRSQLYYRLER